MRINLLVLFTVCMFLVIAAGPAAGYKPSGEEIARIAEKPSVTVVVHGVQNSSVDGRVVIVPGDTVELLGTNTASDQTFLFLTGPGLAVNGSQIHTTDPAHSPVENGNPDTFKQVSVKSDRKWSWTWDTDNYALGEGTYTIYVVPKPNDKDHLAPVPYGTAGIIIRKSAGSATASPAIRASSGNGTTTGKGDVTIVAAGSQAYSLGEEIQFTGTNTAGWKTYLFLTGPNLPDNGANIASIVPRDNPSMDNNLSTFKSLDVNGDHTWSWKWGTADTKLDAGAYTVYAVSQPLARGSHEQAAYGTTSIIIKRPPGSTTASPATPSSGNGTFSGKGEVTIITAGNPAHFLGDEIQFTGTNTETYKTYLFLTGPNLPDNGANIASIAPRDNPSKDNDLSTFKSLDVNGDRTWSWKWETAGTKLDAGSYTIYAVSQPLARGSHEPAAYGTVSIIIKRPLVSATPVEIPTPAKSPGYGALVALIGLGAVVFIVVRRL